MKRITTAILQVIFLFFLTGTVAFADEIPMPEDNKSAHENSGKSCSAMQLTQESEMNFTLAILVLIAAASGFAIRKTVRL